MNLKKIIAKCICKFRGCKYGSPVLFYSPGIMFFCQRCGDELYGRSIDELEPPSDEDLEFIQSQADLDYD